MRNSMNTLKKLIGLLVLALSLSFSGCEAPLSSANDVAIATKPDWKKQVQTKLPMLGHRNWILIVDQAFPEQNSLGMEYIYANEDLLPVLKEVLTQVNASAHVKPIVYQDQELNFITENQAKGVKNFISGAKEVLGTQKVESLLHDEVFKKLDTESKLFKVLVIKTNEVIPYTSVFLQLDCGYWNGDKEKELREAMRK
ncbi:RbsD/FucU domain-containing protein [Pedobacter gandavensis]|uniref:RbsD/FucU domain-containing protein n=1 Tax=Pedobacter gandavensis TaxID=2679963 RepID=UPI00292D5E79|nr:RbsD/FucU domain-containing protein [Pedobacter gandavensis]